MDTLQAAQPEIIRSHQKDEFYQTNLKNEVSRIFIDWFGPKIWMKYQKEIALMTSIGYFCLTTISGFQTLGEEYCSLLQTEKKKLKLPSLSRRSVMILLQCGAPYVADKLLLRAQLWMNHHSNEEKKHPIIENLVNSIRQGITVLSRVHLALFYLQGEFYSIGKRLTGVRYALLRDFLKDSSAKEGYQLLGKLLLLQFAILLPYQLYIIVKKIKSQNIANVTSSEMNGPGDKGLEKQHHGHKRLKCPLCLEAVSDVTTTPCGHLFCWNCIVGWCSKKLECPVCRDKIVPSKLVYLCHFDV